MFQINTRKHSKILKGAECNYDVEVLATQINPL